MLQIKNLSVNVQDTKIIDDVSLGFEVGKNYCILGKNGSGKSSLVLATMGHPKYQITSGDITVDGESIKDLSPDQRAKKGVFLAFQSIPEIPGVKLFEFLRNIYNASSGTNSTFLGFKKIIEPLLSGLAIDKEFLRRDLNVGFSGGEKRKIEALQIKLLNPKYIFLDEIDSGLDVDAFKTIAQMFKQLNNSQNCFIVITHLFSILDYLPVDWIYVLQTGKLITEGNLDVVEKIKESGFSF